VATTRDAKSYTQSGGSPGDHVGGEACNAERPIDEAHWVAPRSLVEGKRTAGFVATGSPVPQK
jgi:hypothetical protein